MCLYNSVYLAQSYGICMKEMFDFSYPQEIDMLSQIKTGNTLYLFSKIIFV